MTKTYSISHSRKILLNSYEWYKKKGKTLPKDQLSAFESDMTELDKALVERDRSSADRLSRKIEAWGQTRFKKNFFEIAVELFFALIFALVIATIVRQMWFELYEIPTGSMRPTFREQDHLTVTKTAFGLNVPLQTAHFYFDPSLIQRTGVVIFSGENLPFLNDTTSTYFGIIPYTKRYIKRLMAKPGDSLYFYGGKIYSIDKEGHFNSELLSAPWIEKIEHIPFLNFTGEVVIDKSNQILLHQMGRAIGKLSLNSSGNWVGEVFNGTEWIKDRPSKETHDQIQTLSDLWGFRNYAMARLLTKNELQQSPNLDLTGLEPALLYLELKHTPSLTYPNPVFPKGIRVISVVLSPHTTLIPLHKHHLDAIMKNMYTARFVEQDGRATRYSESKPHFSSESPLFPGVANGTYEFYYGKAYQVKWAGIDYLLADDNALYKRNVENIQKLFNMGMEMNTIFMPHAWNQFLFPHRYAYFREGDLYLLGAPILKKEDPVLIAFNERERKREESSSADRPYLAFKDHGPPMKEGEIDRDFIRKFGLTVPEKSYLMLGDNHAMSSDSRVFGFVPQANVQGAPSLIIWPPGDRWGRPAQKPYPLITLPRLIVWGCALFAALISYAVYRYRRQTPIFKKIDFQT